MTLWNRSGDGGLARQEERPASFSGRRILHWLGLALLMLYVAALVTAPWYMNRGQLSLAYLVLYFVLLASSWNIVSGFTGYINFAHAAFIGMGMYGAAIAIVDYQLHWLLAVALGGLISAAYAAVLSFPLLRVKGPCFAITTLAIAEGTRVLMSTGSMEPLTRAGSGIPLFVRVSMETKYLAMLALVVAVVLVTYLIANSRIGLRLPGDPRGRARGREPRHRHDPAQDRRVRAERLLRRARRRAARHLSELHRSLQRLPHPVHRDPDRHGLLRRDRDGARPVIGGTVLELLNDYVWTHVLRLNMAAFGVVLVVLILFLPQGILEWLKERDYLPKTREI